MQKYADLNLQSINQKLSQCKPAYNLLFVAGFKKSNNNTRLKWINTYHNVIALKKVHDALQTFDKIMQSGLTYEEAITANNVSNANDTTQTINPIYPILMSKAVWFIRVTHFFV